MLPSMDRHADNTLPVSTGKLKVDKLLKMLSDSISKV